MDVSIGAIGTARAQYPAVRRREQPDGREDKRVPPAVAAECHQPDVAHTTVLIVAGFAQGLTQPGLHPA